MLATESNVFAFGTSSIKSAQRSLRCCWERLCFLLFFEPKGFIVVVCAGAGMIDRASTASSGCGKHLQQCTPPHNVSWVECGESTSLTCLADDPPTMVSTAPIVVDSLLSISDSSRRIRSLRSLFKASAAAMSQKSASPSRGREEVRRERCACRPRGSRRR